MKVALIGLPQSGKTTMFQALTGVEGAREKAQLTLGSVKVRDSRLDRLSAIYHPVKTTHATIELVEAHATHQKERKPNESPLDGAFLNLVKPMDAFLLVVRAFDELSEPATDVNTLLDEMILADLMLVETRLERDRPEFRKGRPGMGPDERAALEHCRELLDQGQPVHSEKELAARPELRTYALLTARPILVVANIAEEDIAKEPASVLSRLGLPVRGLPTFAACAKVEAEIQALPPEEQADFRAALGVQEPVLDVLIREAYAALGLISFLTVGEDECRAWTIRRGTPAVRAAGAVHSDMERGFIRAEVIAYDDFIALGSEAAARKAGKYRLEGRDYVMQDGDIVHFRFNV